MPFPLLSLKLVNQGEPCDLIYGGDSARWTNNPSSIATNQTLSQITCQPTDNLLNAVDANMVFKQNGTPVWQIAFWCPYIGENNVTPMQRGWGQISVRLSRWNSRSSPLVVTGTILQTGLTALTAGVEPDDWVELPEPPLGQILYRRIRRGRRRTSSIVRLGHAAPNAAPPTAPPAS